MRDEEELELNLLLLTEDGRRQPRHQWTHFCSGDKACVCGVADHRHGRWEGIKRSPSPCTFEVFSPTEKCSSADGALSPEKKKQTNTQNQTKPVGMSVLRLLCVGKHNSSARIPVSGASQVFCTLVPCRVRALPETPTRKKGKDELLRDTFCAGEKQQKSGTSLVAQWLRICLPMQGTWVRALVWEDPTYHEATKPVCHNYCACPLEPVLCNKRPR